MYRRDSMVCNIFLAALLILFLAASVDVKVSEVKLKIEYGEPFKSADGGAAQLYYSENEEEFCEEKSLQENIVDGYVVFPLPEVDLTDTRLRFDPVMSEEDFSIRKVDVLLRDRTVWSLSGGEELSAYIEYTINCERAAGNEEKFISKSEDPIIGLSSKFNEMIADACKAYNLISYSVIALFLYL